MKAPKEFSEIIDGKRYDVTKATLIADDCYWDGHNMERRGTNTFLYRTAKGSYFTVRLTMWQGERDTLNPITQEEAIAAWQTYLPEHHVEYEEAFPGVKVEDA